MCLFIVSTYDWQCQEWNGNKILNTLQDKMFNKVLKETNLFFCEASTLGDDVMLSCTKHRNGTGDNVSFILQSVY